MKGRLLLCLPIICCSCGPGQRVPKPVEPVYIIPEDGEHGLYDRPVAVATYELIDRNLGGDSRLSMDEKQAFWNAIRGRDIVWTGRLVEVGEPRRLAVPARLQVGRKSPSWDTLVFFNPENEEKLRLYSVGDTFTFRGSLESYEKTTLGIQVTVAQGRFATPPE